MKKTMTGIAVTAMMTAAMGFSAFAGTWGSDANGTWYQFDSGAYASDCITEIDGVSYGFNQSGYMMTGWQYQNGKWYYYDLTSGGQCRGWQAIDGTWFYFNTETGQMHTGWLDLGAKRYYLNESGYLQTGLFEVAGSPYLYEADGEGALIRNLLDDTNESTTGIAYWHREDGSILYRTNNTAHLNNSWQVLMASGYQEEQISQQQAEVAEKIQDKKDELAERYKENVYTAKSSKSWQKRLQDWEDRVNRNLQELGVSQEEINGFIADVKAGTYDDSDDDYDYDYDYDYD